MTTTFRALSGALALAALGCGSDAKVAPVSGTVTLDGKPLPNAWVTFMPVGSKDNPNPGMTSTGKTDAGGKYTLAIEPGKPGAVVGRHKVSINAAGDGQDDRDAGGPPQRERVPATYNTKSTLEQEVPAGGTDSANFDLKSR